MLHQMTFEDLPNVTFSPASPVGVTPCNLPAGMQTVRSGQALAPVRHSAPPESKRVLPMSGICGQPSSISSKSAALNMSLANKLKTQLSTVGSIEYIETWKEKATPAGVLYWAHTASVPRIKDNGCIGDAPLLTFPTPCTMDHLPPMDYQKRLNHPSRPGRKTSDNLREVVTLTAFPTPSASNIKGTCVASGMQRLISGHQQNLQDIVLFSIKPYATTTTQDFKSPVQTEIKQMRLRAEVMTVAAYHTPRANDAVKNGAIANDPRNGLPAQVLIMPWPTILSSEARQGFQDRTRGKKGSQESLSTVIYKAAWSTPQTMDSMECIRNVEDLPKNAGCSNLRKRVIQVILGSDTNSSTAKTERFGGYRLNPYFSAWLMGFPKKWTEAGMAAFQKLTVSRSRSKKRGDRCS